jgi:hypothetical protein
MDWPNPFISRGALHGAISSFSPWTFALQASGAPSSGTWPAANRAIFVPLAVPIPILVAQLWAYNGADGTTGNVDIGIYGTDGSASAVKLVSTGSTARSGANVLQVIDVTDTLIGPGLYYLALACDSATAAFFKGAIGTQACRASGMFQMANAFALPAAATLAAVANSYLPVFGLTTRAVL